MMHGSMGDGMVQNLRSESMTPCAPLARIGGRDRVGPSGSSFFLIVEKEFREGYGRVWGPAALELYCK